MSQAQDFLISFEEEIQAELIKLFKSQKLLKPEDRLPVSSSLAKALADYLAMNWGGQQIYIPLDSRRRSRMAYDEFTGDNHADLALKFGVSVTTIYKWLKQQKNENTNTNANEQCSLFD